MPATERSLNQISRGRMQLGDDVSESVVDRIRSHGEQIIESERNLFYSGNWTDSANEYELPREVWAETRRNRVEQIAEMERLGKACIAEAANIYFEPIAVTRELGELYQAVYSLGSWEKRDDDLASGRNVKRLGVPAQRDTTSTTIRLPIKPEIAEKPPSPLEPPIEVIGRELCLFGEIGRIQKSLAAHALEAMAIHLKSLQPKGKENCSVNLGKQSDPPIVFGKRKRPLTTNQFKVVKCLCDAFPNGATKGNLESDAGVTDPVGTLKDVKAIDPDWDRAIECPGKKGAGGYRLNPLAPTEQL